jgi:hypothetical protein
MPADDFIREKIEMSFRNIAPSVVAVVIMTAGSITARAADIPAPAFDRVFPSVYSDLLFNSKTAYEGKRYEEAFPLMQKAACAGDKESQWMLGHMYLLGQGVARDDFTGYAWIKVAAEFNSHEYRSTVETIEKAIGPKQLPAVRTEARKYIDNYGLRATNMSCNLAASQHGHIMDRIVCTPKDDGQFSMLRQCVAEMPAQPPAQTKVPPAR